MYRVHKKYKDLRDCNTEKHPNSFREHLIVYWNTRYFLQNTLEQKDVEYIYSQFVGYLKTEKFVEENFETLRDDLLKFDMVSG
jgi:hypothetical protein